MKIEKITENKIRIILKPEDIKDKNLDLHTIMTKTAESQGLLLEILSKAKEEIGFDTDGCRLLIEAYSSPEDFFVFTVTKYTIESDNSFQPSPRKTVKVKRKSFSHNTENSICQFENFENFCNFCNLISNSNKFALKGLVGLSSLYLFNNNYFLVLKNINVEHKFNKVFFSYITEFGKFISYSEAFENKFKEYGKVIMKKNAVSIGIKYFCN